VRDIARKAGITDAAIYYHFDSKRELLEALVEERGFVTSLQTLERVNSTPIFRCGSSSSGCRPVRST